MKALEPFFNVLLSNWPGLAGLLGFYFLFKILASSTFKGWFGEKELTTEAQRTQSRMSGSE